MGILERLFGGGPGLQDLFFWQQPKVRHHVMVRAERHQVLDFIAPTLGSRHDVVDINGVLKTADDTSAAIGTLGQSSPMTCLPRLPNDLATSSFSAAFRRAILIKAPSNLIRHNQYWLFANSAVDQDAVESWVELPDAFATMLVPASRRTVHPAFHGFCCSAEQAFTELTGLLDSRLPAATIVVA